MRIAFFVFVIIFSSSIQAQELTLENIFEKGAFYPKTMDDVYPVKGNNNFIRLLKYKHIVLYDSALNEIDTLFSVSDSANKEIHYVINFSYSADRSLLLLHTNADEVYRYSYLSQCFLYNIRTKELTSISNGDMVRGAELLEKADVVTYVKDNNIFSYNLYKEITDTITRDGIEGEIINGVPDWLYEEEFACKRGFAWSPDEKLLAYYKFNEREVGEYSFQVYTGESYPEQKSIKYPKAGEKNPAVSLYVYNAQNGKSIQVNMGEGDEYYVPFMYWTPDNQLAILQLTRLQNKLNILLVDAATGSAETIYTEQETEYFHGIRDGYFSLADDGESFIIKSERTGYTHFYRYNLKGEFLNPITTGEFDAVELLGINGKEGTLYYSSKERDVLNKDVYSISIDGKNKRLLTNEQGWHNVIIASDYSTFIDNFSNANTPGITIIRSVRDGELIKTLYQNDTLVKRIDKLKLNYKEFVKVPINDSTGLNAFIIKPSNFKSWKKYPVLVYMYGGPESQLVTNRWKDREIWFYYMAQQGYVVACVDNRGTNGRGEEFAKSTYLNLGKLEVSDQVTFANYLANLKYVDEDRIGTFGWSYGGYLSSLCLMQKSTPFKAGIAVAPVTHWKFYDSAYTERYMQTPQTNKQGYEAFAPVNMAENLEAKLLLVHGTADDNVHSQNSMELINELIAKNKKIDLQIYPNRNHGIYGGNATLHLYQTMTDFIIKNL